MPIIMMTEAEIERAKQVGEEQKFFKNVAALNSSLSGCLALTSLGVTTRINAIRRVGETLCKLCDLMEGKEND